MSQLNQPKNSYHGNSGSAGCSTVSPLSTNCRFDGLVIFPNISKVHLFESNVTKCLSPLNMAIIVQLAVIGFSQLPTSQP